MKVYVDSSVLIRFLFREPGQVRDWGQWTLAMTSEFTRVEVSRAVERVGVLGQVSAAELGELSRDAASLFDPMHMLPLEELVLKRAAGRFPTREPRSAANRRTHQHDFLPRNPQQYRQYPQAPGPGR